MELANIILALGGDQQNTVPKYEVTPAEIAVLMAIHGNDAVKDITPLDKEADRSNREEMARLIRLYPATDADNRLIVTTVYAGQNPVMHTTIEDLGLGEEYFKALTRVTAKPKPKKGRKANPKKTPPPIADQTAEGDENDATALFD